ncbi:MAG: AmmeMemoRadiSam system radical SAM enzyme [Candidatus Bilamarchaeaceae archaeon]
MAYGKIVDEVLWEKKDAGEEKCKRGRNRALIRCKACNRYCIIPDGEAGFCGVRANDQGKLRLSVYGRPVAVNIDPVEKKPVFHFLPGTEIFSLGTFGCNFACGYCQNWDITQAPQDARKEDPKKWKAYFDGLLARMQEWGPERVYKAGVNGGCKSFGFTYNEPTIFSEYAADVMKLGRKSGMKGVYVTNGYESKECMEFMRPYIDVMRIDLKAFSERFYRGLVKAELQPVLDNIKRAKKTGYWVEVVTLLVPGENDNPEELMEAAKFLKKIDPKMPWHLTAFYPSYKMMEKIPTPAETLLQAREIALEAGLKYVYLGNMPPQYWKYESTYCDKCGEMLIKRGGVGGFEARGLGVVENRMKKGKCPKCKNAIPGVWE